MSEEELIKILSELVGQYVEGAPKTAMAIFCIIGAYHNRNFGGQDRLLSLLEKHTVEEIARIGRDIASILN